MMYDEAMASPDRLHWEKAVKEEHEKMVAHGVWVPVKRSDLTKDDDIIDTVWAMKKKANGDYRARINA